MLLAAAQVCGSVGEEPSIGASFGISSCHKVTSFDGAKREMASAATGLAS